MARYPFVVVVCFFATPLFAQFAETVKPGDCFKIELSLSLAGKLKMQLPGGKVGSEPLEATARHAYVERIDTDDRVRRAYSKAASTTILAGAKQDRELPANRTTIVRQSFPAGPQCYHPEHALTRDELELASGHFDTVALTRLIPADAATKESWKVADEVTAALCQFDSLSSNGLFGKRIASGNGADEFAVEGTAEGAELGAAVKVKVKARVTFSVAAKRVTAVTWEQEDDRAQGPASPAAELKATVHLKREQLAEWPATLIPFPVPAKVPDSLLNLHQADAGGKYTLFHSRSWHVTGQTNEHLVLRLIEDGDWTAQATILALKPTPDGSHMTPAAFKEAVVKQPGWEPAAVSADGELAAGPGRWLYRLTSTGKQDGLAVVQSFFCLADAAGNQVVVTVVARDDRAAKLGTRGVDLVKGIAFPGKK